MIFRLFSLFLDKIYQFPYQIKYKYYHSKYNIHKSFIFNGNGIIFYGDGEINISQNSYIGRYSYLQSSDKNKISIGKNVSISHNVSIYTSSNVSDQDFSFKRSNKFKIKNGDVKIGNFCWIGAKVFINPGIEIGENTIVGANSVVTRDLPPHSIAVGMPAKVIKFKSYLNNDDIIMLSKSFSSVLSDSLKSYSKYENS